MAGRKLGNAAYLDKDWQAEIESKNALKLGYSNIKFDNLDNETGITEVLAGSLVEIEGVIYIFDADETIAGTPTDGQMFVKAVGGATASLVFASDPLPAYDYLKQGYYDGSDRFIFAYIKNDIYNYDKQFLSSPVNNINGNILKSRYSLEVSKLIDSNIGFIRSIGFDGSDIISIDSVSTVYRHNGLGGVGTSLFTLPYPSMYGLFIESGDMYILDATNNIIRVYNGISSSEKSTISTPATNAVQMNKGLNGIISYDQISDKIYIHDGFSSTILNSFDVTSGAGVPAILATYERIIYMYITAGSEYLYDVYTYDGIKVGSGVSPNQYFIFNGFYHNSRLYSVFGISGGDDKIMYHDIGVVY